MSLTTSDAKPRWFISRAPGVFVALIPADELPQSVNLRGVSRTLTTDQMVGMSFVADAGPSKQRFLLQSGLSGLGVEQAPVVSPTTPKTASPSTRALVPGSPHRTLSANSASPESKTLATTIVPASRFFPPTVPTVLHRSVSSGAAVVATPKIPTSTWNPLPPSGILPDERKKIYCTHWMAHQTCHFSQTGCKYKHEFPEDLATLQGLGFSEWPKWYKEKQAAQKGPARVPRAREENTRSSRSSLQKGQQKSDAAPTRRLGSSIVIPSATRVRGTPRYGTPKITEDMARKETTDETPEAPASPASLSPPMASRPTHGLDGANSPKADIVLDLSDLIDLSDEGDRFSTGAANSSAAPSISTASSDTEGGAEPLTPEPVPAGLPILLKAMIVPPGQASPVRQERLRGQQTQRGGRRGGKRGGRGGAAGQFRRGSAGPAVAAAATQQKKAVGGIHASKHAGPDA